MIGHLDPEGKKIESVKSRPVETSWFEDQFRNLSRIHGRVPRQGAERTKKSKGLVKIASYRFSDSLLLESPEKCLSPF